LVHPNEEIWDSRANFANDRFSGIRRSSIAVREIPFDFAQGRPSPRWKKRGAFGMTLQKNQDEPEVRSYKQF